MEASAAASPLREGLICNLYEMRERRGEGRLWVRESQKVQHRIPPLLIYPKYDGYVVRKEGGERTLDVMPWGIITTMKGKRPNTTVKKVVTNVRNLQSAFWKSTLTQPEQRCLVPFTSFAEPRSGRDPNTGKPNNWWFSVEGDGDCSAFAGIWRFNEGEPRFAFLTCEPNPLVAPRHPKAMPVILQPEDYDRWLDGETDDACSLAAPFPSQLMSVREQL